MLAVNIKFQLIYKLVLFVIKFGLLGGGTLKVYILLFTKSDLNTIAYTGNTDINILKTAKKIML